MNTNTPRTSKNAAIVVATLTSFLGPFMSSSLNVALPSIGQEFSMGPAVLGWMNTAFLLAAATFLIPFGRLGDIYGRKKIFIWGLFLLLVSSVLIAISHSIAMMLICRVAQGCASSMIFATMIPILISVVPANERGRALGITTAAVYFGLSAGPFLGGIITEQLGWRFIFWLNLPLGLILLAVTFLLLKGDWAEAHGQKFDLTGSAILGIALIAAMYGFSTLPSAISGLIAVVGLIGIVFFIYFEKRVIHPIVDIALFRHNTVFAFSNLAALINYAATFAVGFLMSLYLQNVKALSPQTAGLVLVAQPFVQAVFSPLTGRLSDKHEPRTLASLGMIGTLLGLVMLAFLGTATPLWYIVICLIILGFGFALFSSPNTNAIMSSVERPVYGVASATLSTMRQMGMMFSMGTVMMAISLLMGKADIGPDNTGQFLLSMRISFILFAVLSFGGIFASLARGKMNRANESN